MLLLCFATDFGKNSRKPEIKYPGLKIAQGVLKNRAASYIFHPIKPGMCTLNRKHLSKNNSRGNL